MYYGITNIKTLLDNSGTCVRFDESSMTVDGAKLLWSEIGTIVFQPAEGFGPAIVLAPKDGSDNLEVPASIGVLGLIKLGAEIEEIAKKHSIEIERIEVYPDEDETKAS